jgi:hypothetical protein
MRKILLATTALVGFAVAGAAEAATSPLTVTVGGGVEFVAGAAHESKASGAINTTGGDFESIYSLNFGVAGKAANGIEYGGDIVIDNDVDSLTLEGSSANIGVSKADIFMSGAFGKIVLGDTRGATELSVKAPSVVGIRYLDFLGAGNYAKNLVTGVDSLDHSTNVTYFTPKVGNEMHKVQAGVTYVPQFYEFGSDVQRTGSSAYRNVVKGALAYTGNFKPVAVSLSGDIVTAAASRSAAHATTARPFTSFGVGMQAAYNGFTFGGNYANMGHYNTIIGQDKEQQQFGAGVTYEFNKVTVGANYLGGEGYSSFAGDYAKEFNNYALGGTYTWAPGLSTNVNGVLFGQKTEAGLKNDGYVLLVSQKLAF